MHNLIDDRTRTIALALTDRVGWTLIHRLVDRFGTLEAVLSATPDELKTVHGIGKQIAANIRAIDLDRLAADLQRFEAQGITPATWEDPHYPARLSELDDKPLALFWKGTIEPQDAQAIAIVGTRQPAETSIRLAQQWAADLAAHGWTIISGLARGIDTAAHEGALAANGRTIAVLGCGVNVIYPPENRPLAEQVIASGALISEVHPNTAPAANTLMRRNRLTAGLSRAVIVVEAPADSGALHAARYAHAQGKPVFAVDNSEGNAALLREFARELPGDVEEMSDEI
jgi:DNA processing protein